MQRRARPLLGTLVEIGASTGIDAGFTAIAELQAQLSRFESGSDIARFNAMPVGGKLRIGALAVRALTVARQLQIESGGIFDVSLGSGSEAWHLDGDCMYKFNDAVTLDLGGIAKGLAVDVAVEALQNRGVTAGWVNAGGDLRVFGDIEVPILVRDEAHGGAREFARLRDGAFATSHYGPGSRSVPSRPVQAHVSVAAPLCLWADALTKIVALSGGADHPLLARFDALAWRHDALRHV